MIKNCIFLQVLWESWILDLGFCKECIQNAFFPKSQGVGLKIQGSQKNLESKEVGFKIQDSKKNSWIQGGRIQDSRFKAQKQLLHSNLFGLKIQDSPKKSWIQGGRIQDSRFKARKKLLESKGVGFKIQGSRLRKNCFIPTSLYFKFKIQGSKKLLQSHLLGFKIYFLDLESWILPPWIQ